jgi:hypothetical protein
MANGKSDLKILDGSNNILLIAPHGHPKNDENTGKLVRLIAEQSGCYAIINEYYRRPAKGKKADKSINRINLNSIPEREFILTTINGTNMSLDRKKLATLLTSN